MCEKNSLWHYVTYFFFVQCKIILLKWIYLYIQSQRKKCLTINTAEIGTTQKLNFVLLTVRLNISISRKTNLMHNLSSVLLYLYRARNKITQFSIPTRAQLQRHRLKFNKNHLKNSYMFRSSTIFRELQCPR